MDRRKFLQGVCGAGICGCALNFFSAPAPLKAEDAAPSDQRLAFASYQVAKLAGFMAAGKDAAACAGFIEMTGRECAKLGQLQAKFKGDPEGYLAAIRKLWGTESARDREKGIITVTVAEGECGCQLVDPKRTPAFWCNGSVGYQKESFETVFAKPVQVALKESKLAGSTRCVFEVKV